MKHSRMNYSRRNFISNLRNQPELIKAIIQNNLSVIRRLLKNEINSCVISDQNRRTPLHLAASLGRTEVVEMLIQSECYSVNYRDNDLVTPLHRACRNNHSSTVRALIAFHAEINARSRLHITPLHVCATFNSLDCAELIIDQVSNIDVTDSFGATALHYAVHNDNIAMIKFLLENGAKADVQDKYGQRPIHYAAIVDNPMIIRILVEQGGADVNVRNKDLLTPLHFAVAFRSQHAFHELLSLNANLEAQDIHGNNPSHWAAFIGCENILETIMEQSKLTSPNLNGITPLHFACSSQTSFNVAIKIMDLVSEIDVADKFHRTPLHYAAMNGRKVVANELIARGAYCDACDINLETPIHKATQNCHTNVIELLNHNGADVNIANKDGFTSLHLAVMAALPMNCKALIQAGANPLLWDNCGRTPHYMAVFKGSFDCFYQLMTSPVYKQTPEEPNNKPVFPELDAFKRSLLHYAAASNVCSHEFIELLLLRNNLNHFASLDTNIVRRLEATFRSFDINQQDIFGRTPLHYVCRRPMDIESDIAYLVHLLIQSGADCSVLDHDNRLPFHYAVANGYTSALSYLIKSKWLKNRDLYRQYFSASCPLKIAAYYGQYATLTQLLTYGFNDYEGAIEMAVRRFNWNCVLKLINLIRKKSLLRKLALITAFNGVINGLRIFLDIPFLNIDHLLLAAASSKMGNSCIEILLEKGANLQYKDRHGRNALFYAVVGGNVESIKLLLQSGVKFVKDTNGRNVFHMVACKGDLELLKLFYTLSKSYQFYGYLCSYLLSKDDTGLSPLEMACAKGCQNILEYYVTNMNKGFEEKLMYFAGISANLMFVEYLLEKNGPTFLHFRGPYDRTLLHYCCMSKRKNVSMLKRLLELDFDVNAIDDKGLTPLLCACSVGNASSVEYLLEHTESNLLAVDSEGNTALHLASLSANSRTAFTVIKFAKERMMLDQLIGAENNLKQTCLHLSAKKSLSTVVHELLRCGASATDEDLNGYTPSLYCARDAVSAYCLLIIETYMEQESTWMSNQPANVNQNESAENGSLRPSLCRRSLASTSDSGSSVDKRRSFRDEWEQVVENRMRRLSRRETFSRLSSKNSLKDHQFSQTDAVNSRSSVNGALLINQNNSPSIDLMLDSNENGCDTLVDSDSDMY